MVCISESLLHEFKIQAVKKQYCITCKKKVQRCNISNTFATVLTYYQRIHCLVPAARSIAAKLDRVGLRSTSHNKR